MVSGKVGGWKNKLTILQGQFWILNRVISTGNIYFHNENNLFSDSLTFKAQRLYEKCKTEISEYEELPNIMEYGKQPFKLWICNW